MSNKLELLSGPAIDAALKDANAKVYRYVLNPVGLYIAIGLAVVVYALGGVVYWQTRLDHPVAIIAFTVVMFVGVAITAVAAYWHQYATQNLVGVSDERLFVGGPKATWVIAWELLDRRAMGFEQLQMTRLRGALQMHVGGQDINLHLFNVFAYLGDIEGFMHGVLSNLQIDEDAVVGELDDEDASAEEE